MQKFFSEAAAYVAKNRHHRTWLKVVSCLACVVVFCTTYALILPAITLEDNTVYCGYEEEHVHTEDCYTQELICGKEEGDGAHTHTEECYETQKVLVCEQEEGEGHVHTDECYETQEVLICGQEESEGHVHTEDCYSEAELTCGYEEEHIHTEECYQNPDASEETPAAEPLAAETDPADGEKGDSSAIDEEEAFAVGSLTYEGEDYTVTVSYGEDAQIPADAELMAEEIQEDTSEYEQYYRQAAEKLGVEVTADGNGLSGLDFARFFDLSFLVEGEKVEPAAQVKVTIQYADKVALSEDAAVNAVHFAEQGIEVLDVETNDETQADEFTFEQGSFSVTGTVVTNTNNNFPATGEYVLVAKSGENYYAVKNDGTLIPATYNNGTVTFGDGSVTKDDYLWTLSGKNNYTLKATNGYYIYPTQSGALSTRSGNITYSNNQLYRSEGRTSYYLTISDNVLSSTTSSKSAVTFYFVQNVENMQQEPPYKVTYVVDSDRERVGQGQDAGENTPVWKDTVTVTGLEGLTETTETASYTARDVSAQTREAWNGANGYGRYTYSFIGWVRSDTGALVKPGETLELTSDITLTAKWSVHFADTTSDWTTNTLSFFVAINGTVGQFDGASDSYTHAVYTTKVLQGYEWAKVQDTIGVSIDLIGKTSGYTSMNELSGVDALIRSSVNGVTVNYKGVDYTIQLASFPSDDAVLQEIKRQGQTINITNADGTTTTITPEEINAENFTVKWMVLKDQATDGWHVDGMLIRKEASLTVKKNFVGNADAIAAVKDGSYSISVSGSGFNATYSLSNAYAVSDDGMTYTWLVEGLSPNTQYTVEERNADASGDYKLSATYQISNDKTASRNISGSGTSVTVQECYSYTDGTEPDDMQTVTFRNLYTVPYVMTILKQDGTTYHGLSGVKFDLTLTKAGTSSTESYTTDANGNIAVDFTALGSGNYEFKLEESQQEGYTTVHTVTGSVIVGSNGQVEIKVVNTSVTGENSIIEVDANDPSIIYIRNISERIKVTVTKQWTDNTNKQVTMQLLRGTTLLSETERVLNNENNWTYTWENLPLYVDGVKAEYSVREVWIGAPTASDSAHYTPQDDVDGYSDYIVIQSRTVDENGNTNVVVQNTKDNGQVSFTKVDEDNNALSDAEFTVYEDSECTQTVKIGDSNASAIFKSDGNGVVTITGLSTGTYYVKETTAPSGYKLLDDVYTLTVKDRNSTLTLNGTAVTRITNEKVKVTLTFQKVDSTDESKKLSGAELELYDSSYMTNETVNANAVPLARWTSDENGYTYDKSLSPGIYYVVETKAPDGYNLLTMPVIITIKSADVVSVINNANVIETDGEYIITIQNNPGVTLPHTGGPGTWFYTSSGLLIMAGAVMCGYTLRRKRERRTME